MSRENNRLQVNYKNLSEKFLIKCQSYQTQFFHIYTCRLNECTKLLTAKVSKKWGTKYPIKKLCQLRDDAPEECIIIGTIYKHQAFKPSILKEISEENQLAPQPPRHYYAGEDDKLILEDELQRVRLVGNVDVGLMATGVVCAVVGTNEESGAFVVDDILFYEGGLQKSLTPLNQPTQVVFISGIDQINSHEFSESLDLFQHWLCGNMDINTRNIVRLIVAGNSIRSSPEKKKYGLQMKSSEPNETVESVKALDKYFAQWSSSIPIDLMPGEFDPAGFMMPQRPFHPCMLQKASANTSFQSVTNPYACEVAGRLILGTSGQNVRDLLRNTKLDNDLQALLATLKWSHISPTSPDTLACYPFIESDPFIINECPHIYFAGNCEEYQTDIYKSTDGAVTRVICVPSFCKTKTVVVADLSTLECKSVCFKIDE